MLTKNNLRLYLLALVSPIFFVSLSATSLATTYTMSAFTNNSESNMYMYESDDATNYALIKGPAYKPPKGLIRDPSIIRHTDGKYWVTYTTDWSANTIGFAVSDNRENWTFSHNYTLPVANLTESWAPEWFIDPDGSINIIVSLRTSSDNGNFTPSIITAQNDSFTSWTYPVAMEGLSPNYIDTFVVKIENTYHAMTKNETSKYVEYATAANLEGPWIFRGKDNWSGWGNWIEGPSLLKLDNGNWRILFDCYGCNPQKYYYSDSSDQLSTWSTRAELPGGLSGFVRHLTVLKEEKPVTGDYLRLESYSLPGYYLGHANFRASIDNGYVNAQDSRWKIVPGLADSKGLSFQSTNFPSYYLRHTDTEGHLQKNDGASAFKEAATFYQRRGLADSSWASYEAYSLPGMYLMHQNFNLDLVEPSTTQEKANATFALAMPMPTPTEDEPNQPPVEETAGSLSWHSLLLLIGLLGIYRKPKWCCAKASVNAIYNN